MYQPDRFPPSITAQAKASPSALRNGLDPNSSLGVVPSSALRDVLYVEGYSQEKKNTRQSQETNRGRHSQEKKCALRLDFARAEDAVLRVLGLGEDGDCPLPEHDGFASFEPIAPPGREFTCDCLGRSAEWGGARSAWRSDYSRSLSDVYEAIHTGRVIDRDTKPLSKGERFVWTMLLAHEVGLLEPDPVDMPDLRPRATELHRRTEAFFTLLAGLRLTRMAEGDALPMPFSDRLVAAYLRIDRMQAREAINALRAYGVITVVGRTKLRGPYLFEPGETP